jgi:hypothetical protein
MTTDWLPEQLKTISRLCTISQILIDVNHRELLPTVLELMLIEIQNVIDENCVKNE